VAKAKSLPAFNDLFVERLSSGGDRNMLGGMQSAAAGCLQSPSPLRRNSRGNANSDRAGLDKYSDPGRYLKVQALRQ
jgi:hypothetical protein